MAVHTGKQLSKAQLIKVSAGWCTTTPNVRIWATETWVSEFAS